MNALATLCTDQFSQSERMTKWSEFMSVHLGKTPDYIRRLETNHFEPINGQPFNGRLEYGELGNLQFCRMICSAHRFSRTLSKAPRNFESAWLLILQVSEVSNFEQNGVNCSLIPGDILLLDCGLPFSVTSMKGCEYLTLLCTVPYLERNKESHLRLNGRNGLGRMLQHIITDAYFQYNLLNKSAAELIGQSIMAILKNALENQQQAENLTHDFRHFKKQRIKLFIDCNLGKRDLTPEHIAHAVQCSVRTLHRLFEDENGVSLNEYIWQRRLLRCAEELRRQSSPNRSITDIAYSWGFNSSSHFSKTFKSAYGVSPRLFRASSAFENPLPP